VRALGTRKEIAAFSRATPRRALIWSAEAPLLLHPVAARIAIRRGREYKKRAFGPCTRLG
jgi:hypothetical protein